MDKIIAIERDGTSCGIGNTIEESFIDLKDNLSYNIDLDEIIFYEAKEIKVKQQLIKIENGNS